VNKAIFFDRDGVLNELVKRNNEFVSPQKIIDFKINLNAKELIKKARKKNYICICISNQPDVSRNLMSKKELDLMTENLLNTLDLDDIFYCLHDDSDNCECRKPKIGLFKKAINKWDIDISKSIFIGDTWRDYEAGNTLGIKTIIIKKKLDVCLFDDEIKDLQ
tara:strand:- start:591 stop:1079 length:489 start_codon:yes stop_codon:yes gene_type:complete